MRVQRVHDLIVVGAGPGGSNAAAVALRSGLSVAQVDAARFPRVKPCAGGLTVKALGALQFELGPSLRGAFDQFEFNAWRGTRTVYTFRSRLLTMVSRPHFDDRLVEENCRSSGFDFFDGERVRAIEWSGERFLVRTDARAIAGRQLVGADGANGIVNRVFRCAEPRGRAIAVEVNPRREDVHGDPVPRPCFDFGALPRGYGWVFPKDDSWSVGLYTLERGIKDLPARLRDYLVAKGFCVRGDPVAGFEAHPIPLGGDRLRDPGAPVYVVGDAAGLADALTGEGIYHALESGRIAGETAAGVARGECGPERYRRRLRASVLRDTSWTWKLARPFYRDPALSIRLLRLSGLWKPLVHGTGSGATFSECLTRGGAFLLRSLRERSARRADVS